MYSTDTNANTPYTSSHLQLASSAGKGQQAVVIWIPAGQLRIQILTPPSLKQEVPSAGLEGEEGVEGETGEVKTFPLAVERKHRQSTDTEQQITPIK